MVGPRGSTVYATRILVLMARHVRDCYRRDVTRRSATKRKPAPRLGSWSDLPIRVASLTWSEWLRATLYTVLVLLLVLAGVVVILLGGGTGIARLIAFIRAL